MVSATEYTSPFHTKTYPYIDPTQTHLSTSGKTVLITGGGSGIGAGIVRSFARSSAQNIIILDLSLSALESSLKSLESEFPNSNFTIFQADITHEDAIKQIFSEIPPVDILVKNAGFLSEPVLFIQADLKDWWRAFEVNVLGTAIMTQYFLDLRTANAHSRVIINLNSSVAHCGIFPTYSSYCASKMASLRMMESFQAENPGVRIVSINPGGVGTEMYKRFQMPDDFEMTDIQLPGDFCVWLCSGEAAFLAGKMVWGQWHAEELIRKKEDIAGEKAELATGLKGIDGSLY